MQESRCVKIYASYFKRKKNVHYFRMNTITHPSLKLNEGLAKPLLK